MAQSSLSLFLILSAILISLLCRSVQRGLTVIGVYQGPVVASSAAQRIYAIPDTVHCEDIHYYAPGDILFTACEDSVQQRFRWFPPLALLDGPVETTGSIRIINPQTKVSSQLMFENFPGPFVTHGIDVIQDPDRAEALYIFAVNHLPNPEYSPATEAEAEAPKARSQVEVFHYVLNSSTIRHVRSVRHPLITTPNDLYATSPYSFYVTNDHHYREGFLRELESIPGVKWAKVLHVQLDRLDTDDATAGVNTTVALASDV
ncbi:serum paraoxonase/arylesterase family protein [Aspergillus lucknowensis]|uniref:Uncharacterized protein n=1 Tax=Aspergillus lucknowensis TaxID=176173 RepID=A0ABR4LFT4_9EURO